MFFSECEAFCQKFKAPYREKFSDDILDKIQYIAFWDFGCLNHAEIDDLWCGCLDEYTLSERESLYELYDTILNFLNEEKHKSLKPILDKYKDTFPEDVLLDLREVSIYDYHVNSYRNRSARNGMDLVDLMNAYSYGKYHEHGISIGAAKDLYKIYIELVAVLEQEDR